MDSVTAYLGQHLRFHSKLWLVRIQRLKFERALVEFKRIKEGRERLSVGCWEVLMSEGSFLVPRLSDAVRKQLIAWAQVANYGNSSVPTNFTPSNGMGPVCRRPLQWLAESVS